MTWLFVVIGLIVVWAVFYMIWPGGALTNWGWGWQWETPWVFLYDHALLPVGKFLKRYWYWFVLGVVLVGAAIACYLVFGYFLKNGLFGQKSKPATEPAAATEVLQETPAPTAAPTEAPTEVQTASPTEVSTPEPVVQDVVRLAAGEYLNNARDMSKYQQSGGTYIVPITDFWGYQAVLFEGEFYDSVGIHSICYWYVSGKPDGSEKYSTCKLDGNNSIHINQGSFWGYQQNVDGDLPEDVLAVFAHDKWKNWHDQGINGNPIEIYFSNDKVVKYAAGEEPVLTPEQKLIVDRNAADRCPASEPEKLENPYSDNSSNNDPVVVGAPGSYACRTLFVGQQAPDGALVAYYWRGAKDGFSYVAKATSFYLVPESWGEAEMKAFVNKLNAEFLGQLPIK